jgi:hypothetical protein
MSERLEWRWLYGTKLVLFADGVACGDCYALGDTDIFKVRLWPPDRVEGGRQRLVIDEDVAREQLVQMLGRAQQEADQAG